MRFKKANPKPTRICWPELFESFLASGEDCVEIVGTEENYKNKNSAYLSAFSSAKAYGYDKAIAVRSLGGKIYFQRKVRKDG